MSHITPDQLKRGMTIITVERDRRVQNVIRDVIPPVRNVTCPGYHITTQNGGHWCWSPYQAIEIVD